MKKMLQRAAESDADAVIFDLEDAVAEARALVREHTVRYGAARSVYVRVNAVPTGLLEDDLAAICMPELAGIWLPMAEKVEEVKRVDEGLSRLEAECGMAVGEVNLLLSLETARGVHFAFELASTSKRVTALSAGTAEGGDLHAEMGGLVV